LDNDNDEDIPDDGVSEYERQRLERIAQNNARLAMLGLINNQEKKKKKKKDCPTIHRNGRTNEAESGKVE
jgi:hypothetical protein